MIKAIALAYDIIKDGVLRDKRSKAIRFLIQNSS